jgi:cyclopropane-fatty-acyl-phospholipid synthase
MAIDTPARPDAAPLQPSLAEGAPKARDRRTALAQHIVDILAKTVPPDAGVVIQLGGEPDLDWSVTRVRLRDADAVGRLVGRLSEDALAEAYLRGDIEIDGDVGAAIDAGRSIDLRRLDAGDVRRLIRFGLELRRGTAMRPRLHRLARLTGRRHSRARDLAAIRFHYDVGETFYRLWLDRRLTYSCAYFEQADDPAADLDLAQEAKLELICQKLGLAPGQRLLDIGCGWASLILYAAERHGVTAVGVTLSEWQAIEANQRARDMGLADQVRAEVRDYRDLDELGTFDAVASVGMFEHVGSRNLRSYFEAAFAALAPGGRFVNHGIATAEHRPSWGSNIRRNSRFVERYVFPDGELVSVEQAIAVARDTVGFELLDVQMLRPHYALTLRAWVERLERSWSAAVDAGGDEVARTWRLYMSGARIGFERGELDVAQLLFAKPQADGTPAPHPLRPWWIYGQAIGGAQMGANVGDRIVLESEKVGTADRRGEILEVIAHETSTEYVVRWDDGRETSIRPHAGSVRIEASGAKSKR